MTDQTYEFSYLDSSTDSQEKIKMVIANCRHLRITANETDHLKIIQIFLNKFSKDILYYVFASEVSEKGVAHIHGHIEWKTVPKKQTLSDYFKKQQLNGKYYHQQLDKPVINNLLYVTKDLKLIGYNFPDDVIKKIKQQTQQINEDKKKSPRHKLLELFKEHLMEDYKQIVDGTYHNSHITSQTIESYKEIDPVVMQNVQLREIKRPWYVVQFIHDTYVKLWDKPPHLSSMKQTALYIMQKITDDETVPISYQDAINNFYEKYIGLF